MAETRQSNGSRERTRQRAAPKEPSLFRAAPVLARLAASAWWRATGWTVQTSVRASIRIARGAARGESPAVLVQEAEAELRRYLRELLDVREGDSNGAAPATREDAAAVDGEIDGHVTEATL